jgi:hypothetical protein
MRRETAYPSRSRHSPLRDRRKCESLEAGKGVDPSLAASAT